MSIALHLLTNTYHDQQITNFSTINLANQKKDLTHYLTKHYPSTR